MVGSNGDELVFRGVRSNALEELAHLPLPAVRYGRRIAGLRSSGSSLASNVVVLFPTRSLPSPAALRFRTQWVSPRGATR
jgi:hypothetical protein